MPIAPREGQAVPPAAPEARSRLTKKLPTFRVGAAKQLDALRAYALLSDNGTKPVHYTRVAEIIKVHEANVSSMNPFFVENGLITKAQNGYLPSPQVLEYNRAYTWKQENAAVTLQTIFSLSWFGQELLHRLNFRPLSEPAAIEALAAACNAGPEAKSQLRILLDLCEAAGIIERANGQLTAVSVSTADKATPAMEPIRAGEREPPAPEPAPPAPQPARVAVSASSNAPQKEGAISLDVSIQVDLAEMQGWTPDRITAFFGGIAQILAAKNKDG